MLVDNKYVPRHKGAFILCHWLNGISFLLLFFTALPLYAPEQFGFLYNAFGPATLQNAHRFFAVIFIVTPIIGIFIAREGYATLFGQVLKFGKADITFLINFPIELLGGHSSVVPKQGFYNGGEKMNIVLQMGVWAVLVCSGLVLWLGSGVIDNSVRAWMIPVHSIAAAIGFAAALFHIYLAVGLYPKSLKGMKDGSIEAGYAMSHHGAWVKELVSEGKVTQKELDEATH